MRRDGHQDLLHMLFHRRGSPVVAQWVFRKYSSVDVSAGSPRETLP
jgi:hypothetical protein